MLRLDKHYKKPYTVRQMEIMELLQLLKEGESTIVEFKETLTKDIVRTICALANTKGGKILIGVKNDGNPVGIQSDKYQQELSDFLRALMPMPEVSIEAVPIAKAKIIIVTVKESSMLISCNHLAYIRVGSNNYPLSMDEVIEKSAESVRIFFDQIITDVPASELDTVSLKDYLEKRERIRKVESDPDLTDVAIRLKILKKKDKGLFLTNGGVLCFTKDPQKQIGYAVVKLTKFEDEEMRTYSFQEEITGPLQDIVDQIEKYFSKNLRKIGGFNVGFKRQEYLEYPLLALREAIINAIVHRNYFDAADIRIFIFPNRIEIHSPGSFPPGISVENPEHKPRNPQIAQFFFDLGYTEKYGSGIKKILKETSEHPFVSVNFLVRPYNTTVIFSKDTSKLNLDDINQKILEVIASAPKGSGEISKAIGLSRQSTIDRLKNLHSIGIIRQEGEGPRTVYVYNKIAN